VTLLDPASRVPPHLIAIGVVLILALLGAMAITARRG
jgi:hypothetical protein